MQGTREGVPIPEYAPLSSNDFFSYSLLFSPFWSSVPFLYFFFINLKLNYCSSHIPASRSDDGGLHKRKCMDHGIPLRKSTEARCVP